MAIVSWVWIENDHIRTQNLFMDRKWCFEDKIQGRKLLVGKLIFGRFYNESFSARTKCLQSSVDFTVKRDMKNVEFIRLQLHGKLISYTIPSCCCDRGICLLVVGKCSPLSCSSSTAKRGVWEARWESFLIIIPEDVWMDFLCFD